MEVGLRGCLVGSVGVGMYVFVLCATKHVCNCMYVTMPALLMYVLYCVTMYVPMTYVFYNLCMHACNVECNHVLMYV